jgi:RimJ/RimL family protein N-acetyltransferase
LVYELSADLFHKAEPLFRETWFDEAQIYAVFEGKQNGRIFVDDLPNPTAALMCRTYEFYVAGSADAHELRRFIAEAPAEAGVFHELYGYCPVGKAWEQALLEDHNHSLEVIDRRSFRFPNEAADQVKGWRDSLPTGIEVRVVDGELAERIDREMHEMIGFFWGGYEPFDRHGFGYCAIVDGQLASVIYTIAVGANQANVSIETAAAFRRKGLAAIVSAAYIEHCLERGLVATWDCDAPNLASYNLAQKLGFVEHEPFSEFAVPGRAPLELSHGLWEKEPGGWEGLARWRRRDQAE